MSICVSTTICESQTVVFVFKHLSQNRKKKKCMNVALISKQHNIKPSGICKIVQLNA